MKTKDLVYIGVIAYLSYLLLKRKPVAKDITTTQTTAVPVGNASNGGLNLGQNMGLPNLTPTPPDGLSTEVALNNSNISPIIKDENIPSQIFGAVTLPPPYTSSSIVTVNPIDVVPVAETVTTNVVNIPTEPIVLNNQVQTNTSTSSISEPIFPIRTIKAELTTIQPDLSQPTPSTQLIQNTMISDCGNSFSIPNNDKLGSYSNYWTDGKDFYMQNTNPLIKTIPVKISIDTYNKGCEKLKLFRLQNV